jgi:hypothetical protein
MTEYQSWDPLKKEGEPVFPGAQMPRLSAMPRLFFANSEIFNPPRSNSPEFVYVMPTKLKLLNGEITYDTANIDESNIIKKLSYVPDVYELYRDLSRHRSQIEALVAHHLKLGHAESCEMSR